MSSPRWMFLVLLLSVLLQPTEAIPLYSPLLCYILDGFLGLYGLVITGMFVREKFFRSKEKALENTYATPQGLGASGYSSLRRSDAEQGRHHWASDNSVYTGLNKQTEGVYKALPVKREQRQRKNEQVYQGLSHATRETYDTLQMQPLPSR